MKKGLKKLSTLIGAAVLAATPAYSGQLNNHEQSELESCTSLIGQFNVKPFEMKRAPGSVRYFMLPEDVVNLAKEKGYLDIPSRGYVKRAFMGEGKVFDKASDLRRGNKPDSTINLDFPIQAQPKIELGDLIQEATDCYRLQEELDKPEKVAEPVIVTQETPGAFDDSKRYSTIEVSPLEVDESLEAISAPTSLTNTVSKISAPASITTEVLGEGLLAFFNKSTSPTKETAPTSITQDTNSITESKYFQPAIDVPAPVSPITISNLIRVYSGTLNSSDDDIQFALYARPVSLNVPEVKATSESKYVESSTKQVVEKTKFNDEEFRDWVNEATTAPTSITQVTSAVSDVTQNIVLDEDFGFEEVTSPSKITLETTLAVTDMASAVSDVTTVAGLESTSPVDGTAPTSITANVSEQYVKEEDLQEVTQEITQEITHPLTTDYKGWRAKGMDRVLNWFLPEHKEYVLHPTNVLVDLTKVAAYAKDLTKQTQTESPITKVVEYSNELTSNEITSTTKLTSTTEISAPTELTTVAGLESQLGVTQTTNAVTSQADSIDSKVLSAVTQVSEQPTNLFALYNDGTIAYGANVTDSQDLLATMVVKGDVEEFMDRFYIEPVYGNAQDQTQITGIDVYSQVNGVKVAATAIVGAAAIATPIIAATVGPAAAAAPLSIVSVGGGANTEGGDIKN